MSYVDSLYRAAQRQASVKRQREREAKRAAMFDSLDSLDAFESDESEIDAMRDAAQRYAIAH